MAKFRIVTNGKTFKVQRKSLFGLWWFKVDKDGWDCSDYRDAEFQTKEEALEFMNRLDLKAAGGFKVETCKEIWYPV
jgi:hypothetical protein